MIPSMDDLVHEEGYDVRTDEKVSVCGESSSQFTGQGLLCAVLLGKAWWHWHTQAPLEQQHFILANFTGIFVQSLWEYCSSAHLAR